MWREGITVVTKLQALTEHTFHDEMCRNWRPNGRVKTWKRDSDRFRLPVKYGLYAYGAITNDNASLYHVPSASCKRNGQP